MEFVKHALHDGRRVGLNFYRDSSGLEADLVVEQGFAPGPLGLVEIRSSLTPHGEQLRPLQRVRERLAPMVERCLLVQDGAEHYRREDIEIVGLHAPPAGSPHRGVSRQLRCGRCRRSLGHPRGLTTADHPANKRRG